MTRIKRHPTGLERIFAHHLFGKGSLSKIYKALVNINKKIFKYQERDKRILS